MSGRTIGHFHVIRDTLVDVVVRFLPTVGGPLGPGDIGPDRRIFFFFFLFLPLDFKRREINQEIRSVPRIATPTRNKKDKMSTSLIPSLSKSLNKTCVRCGSLTVSESGLGQTERLRPRETGVGTHGVGVSGVLGACRRPRPDDRSTRSSTRPPPQGVGAVGGECRSRPGWKQTWKGFRPRLRWSGVGSRGVSAGP